MPVRQVRDARMHSQERLYFIFKNTIKQRYKYSRQKQGQDPEEQAIVSQAVKNAESMLEEESGLKTGIMQGVEAMVKAESGCWVTSKDGEGGT